MKGGRGAKRKGGGFEREVVTEFLSRGILAEKVPLSGAVKSSRFDHDIACQINGDWKRIETKRRARAFSTIDQMLGDNFALVVRDDHSRAMVVMSLEDFCALVQNARDRLL